jgi:GIY-YIG catalytic domain
VEWIYALTEPETGEIRYVGRSPNVEGRYNTHCSRKASPRVREWVTDLATRGLKPKLERLAFFPDFASAEWERLFIALHGKTGRLLNVNERPFAVLLSERGVAISAGLKALIAFLDENDLRQKDLAEGVGVSDGAVHFWFQGQSPNWRQRLRIERFTDGVVPASLWETDEERAELEAVVPYSRSPKSA